MSTAILSSYKPFFWAVAFCAALAGGIFAYQYFGESYPIVSLSIEMDREQAIAKANHISSEHGWLPAEHRCAVEFKSNPLLQFFIELECGGRKVFADLLRTKEYEPYQWHVRHFQEKVTHETAIFFTPNGTPYGFELKLPETEQKPTLTTDAARELAQDLATREWAIDFSLYKEIEASKEQKPCGRLDHTFVYERTDVQLGSEGKYRLKIVVSGDTLTKIERFVFIPETFVRRFEEMRSSNTTVSTFGSLGFQLLYRFLGCLVAGFLFLRRRYLRLTPAIYWGAFFGLFTAAAVLNNLPLAWMAYDTATSSSSFLLRMVLEAFLQGSLAGVIFTVFISVCLAWDRLGFPSHLAFSKLWSSTVGASTAVLGRTLGGYLFVPAWIGFMTVTYFFLVHILHWWSPADTLVNPNILATYVPWLTPFTLSAQAGFNEELLFRALPLAACALGGRALGREKTGIVLGFILQALIFGACHANYPQTPGYFRLVELFVPSLCFGLLYVFYGLLPGIIAHFVYDLGFMSLPIFATTKSSHALLDKVIVIGLLLAPLWIVLYRRVRRGIWYNVTDQDCNRAAPSSDPLPIVQQVVPISAPSAEQVVLPCLNKKIIACAGMAGLALWLWATPFKADTPSLGASKKQAFLTAQQDFTEKEVTTPQGFVWEHYSYLATVPSSMDAFVWREEGAATYHKLLGSYLTPPSWAVRFLSFSGPVVERAQEFTSIITPDGSVLRSNLILPESQIGATLSEGQARGLALEAIHDEVGISPEALKELSAIVQDRPNRKDWTFTFQDKTVPFTTAGQARINVTILGDKVTNVYRHVFVPESWLRDQQQEDVYRHLANFFIQFVVAFMFVLSFFVLQRRLFSHFSTKQTVLWAVLLVSVALLSFFNSSEQLFAIALHSSQPYTVQLFSLLAFNLAKLLVYWSVVALCAAGATHLVTSRVGSGAMIALLAVGAELLRHGVAQTVILLTHDRFLPLIPNYLAYGSYSPLWATISAYGLSFVQSSLLDLICIAGFVHLTKNSRHQMAWGAAFLIASSIAGCGVNGATLFVHPASLILLGISKGALLTAFYYLLVRYDQRAIIMMVGTRAALMALEEGFFEAYPGALLCAGCAAVVLLGASYCWFTLLGKDH